MADYIKGEILAQSYVNLYEGDYERVPVDEVQHDLERRAEELAGRIFGFEVRISVSVQEGSVLLITTLVAAGGFAATLYHAIAEYGSFRGGLKSIVDDAKKFTRHQNESAVATVRPYTESPTHAEARTGLPGALKRVADEIEYLSKNTHNLSPNETAEHLKKLSERTKALLGKIEGVEDREKITDAIIGYVEDRFPARSLPDAPAKEKLPVLPPRKKGVNSFIKSLKDRPPAINEVPSAIVYEVKPRKPKLLKWNPPKD